VTPVKFEVYGTSHITALTLTALFVLFIVLIGRRLSGKGADTALSLIIVMVILSGMGLKFGYNWYNGKPSYPMQLCDWAAILMVYVLIFPDNRVFEPAYFWGLGGTFQALITPDVKLDFPDIKFFTFFLLHCGVVAGVFYAIFVKRLAVSAGGVKRVFIISQLYIAAAIIVNYITGSNYGYLSKKPSSASLLDFLGPWPYYIIGIEVIGLLVFVILYTPFFISQRRGEV
jgi:hypothetical integral membrane protein (TIGR02206 family)